jgi:hypothetical protein
VALACGAPASVTVPASNTTGAVTVSWGASNVTGVTYQVEFSKDGGAWASGASSTSSPRSVSVTSSGSGSYSFRVKATKTGYADSAYTTSGTNCVVTLP